MTIASPKEVRDGIIFKGLNEHYKESLEYFNKNQIVGLFLQGSQNYGLDTPNSDIDTKLIVVPSFKDIALAAQPVSTTHVRANQEHIDFKDIRLYMNTFRKQNLNFLEILFTDYFIIPSIYYEEWMRLIEAREEIAHMNPYRAVKSMQGIAKEKYYAMEHRYPSKVEIIDKYGYDGKQVSHLLRVEDYLRRYIAGEQYIDCLHPTENQMPRIMDYKLQQIPLEIARVEAKESLEHIDTMANAFCEEHEDKEDPEMKELLQDVCYDIMEIAVRKELKI